MSVIEKQKNISRPIKLDFKGIPELELIELQLIEVLSDSKGTVRDMCSHILSAGGKRIRPLLVMHIGMAFGENSDELINTAVAAELIHMASLVHDDIVDESGIRRNKQSINGKWGNNFAVLGGDYLFAKAFAIMSQNGLNNSMNFMVEAIQRMCYGEILQAEDRYNTECTTEKYYEKITCKTATLLEACCGAGAVVAGAREIEIKLASEYGLNLGLAFQITDDILDLTGIASVMGKPKCEDLKNGILTLPIIKLLENQDYHNWIENIIEDRQFNDEIIDMVGLALMQTGIINECYETIRFHIEKAKNCLDFLPDSMCKDFLLSLPEMVYKRIN